MLVNLFLKAEQADVPFIFTLTDYSLSIYSHLKLGFRSCVAICRICQEKSRTFPSKKKKTHSTLNLRSSRRWFMEVIVALSGRLEVIDGENGTSAKVRILSNAGRGDEPVKRHVSKHQRERKRQSGSKTGLVTMKMKTECWSSLRNINFQRNMD